MTDREYRELVKKVRAIVDKWQPILGLNSHRLKLKYIRDTHDSDSYTVATCSALWQYKTHTIRFYMPEVQNCESDDELEEDILHELVHILLAPASGNDAPDNRKEREAVEYATQCITFAFLWSYAAGMVVMKRSLNVRTTSIKKSPLVTEEELPDERAEKPQVHPDTRKVQP